MNIDLEPTWMEILSMVKCGALKAKDSDLEKACQIADIVRKAQKDGKKSLTFTFTEDGQVNYDDSESDEDSFDRDWCDFCMMSVEPDGDGDCPHCFQHLPNSG